MNLVSALHRSTKLRLVAKRVCRGWTIPQKFYGGVIYLDAVEHSWAWTGERRYESFDRQQQDRLLQLSFKSDILLDVGCNVGAMTLSTLLRNREIAAVAIDPNDRALQLLRRSLLANRVDARCQVVRALIGGKPGLQQYDATGSVTGHVGSSGTLLPCIPLAAVIDCFAGEKRCLIKVDIEGFETVALRTLNECQHLRNAVLVVEIHPLHLNHIGDPASTLRTLKATGARLSRLDGTVLTNVANDEFTQVVACWTNE
jgi:FkbM family methyltransferase